MTVAVTLLVVLGAGLLGPGVLTGVGAHRRGLGAPLSVLAAIGFPVTWTVWYFRDRTKPARKTPHVA